MMPRVDLKAPLFASLFAFLLSIIPITLHSSTFSIARHGYQPWFAPPSCHFLQP